MSKQPKTVGDVALVQQQYDTLFRQEKEHPSAYSAFLPGDGKYSSHAFSGDVFSRDEKAIKQAASKFGFKQSKAGNTVIFTIPQKVDHVE